MTVRFVSRSARVATAHLKIGENALRAAALVVQNQAKKNARGGFKSGKFVTTGWNLINHVVRPGVRPRAEIGSPTKHFAYWELGHHNVFTRQYERNEWLKPAMQGTVKKQQEAAEMAARTTAATFGLPAFGSIRVVS